MDRGDYSRLSDAELLRRAGAEAAAYREFYGRHSMKLDAWLTRCVGNKDIAAELTAEAFAQAWFGLKNFDPEKGEDGAGWLYGIGRNLVRQYFRKERIERSARKKLGVLGETTVDEATERLAFVAIDVELRAAVQSLPAHEREAIKLRVVSELSYREVAAVLECTETAARIRVSRALKRLREKLGNRAEVDNLGVAAGGIASEHA